MNPRTFDQITRTLTSKFSRRSILAGAIAAGAATTSPVRALAQTPVTDTTQPVLALRSYIVLGLISDVAAELPFLMLHMEDQPGFLDYRIAELGDSTLATISSFLNQEASDAAAVAEATWIAEQMSDLLTEPVDSIAGELLSWSVIGAGVVCQTMFQNPCPSESLTCCPTTNHTDGPGICVNAQTTCPAVLPAASPAADCKSEGCTCATGTQFPCNDGLSCCPESDDTPPGGPGFCRATCGN